MKNDLLFIKIFMEKNAVLINDIYLIHSFCIKFIIISLNFKLLIK
jgi:hypothetical protein